MSGSEERNHQKSRRAIYGPLACWLARRPVYSGRAQIRQRWNTFCLPMEFSIGVTSLLRDALESSAACPQSLVRAAATIAYASAAQ